MERIDSVNLRKTCSLLEESAPSRGVRRAMLDDSIHALRGSAVEESSPRPSLSDLFGRTQSEDSIDCQATREDREELIESLRRLHDLFPHDSYQLPIDFPKFTHDEVVLGHKLGEGSFSHEHDVLALKTDSTASAMTAEMAASSSLTRILCFACFLCFETYKFAQSYCSLE